MTDMMAEPAPMPVAAADGPPRARSAIAAGGIAYVRAILAGEAEPPPLPETRRWELAMQLGEPYPDANTRRQVDEQTRVRDHFGGNIVARVVTASGRIAVLACGAEEMFAWRTGLSDDVWPRGAIESVQSLAPLEEYEQAIADGPDLPPPGW